MKNPATEILLAGYQTILPLDGISDHIESFYRSNLPALYDTASELGYKTRLIGFRQNIGNKKVDQFIGIEIKNSDREYFNDLIHWQMDSDFLTTIENGREIKQTAIQWNWFKENIGEFQINGHTVFLTALTEINPSLLSQFDDSVELVDYNPEWGEEYRKIAANLTRLFPELINRIEHYGSTSVAKMIAKPIIDILIEVESYDKVRRYFIPQLSGPETEYWWYEDHMIFIIRDKPMGKRNCHLHIAPKGHHLWEGITFRDILRNDPEVSEEYRKLKLDLLARFKNDREKYTNIKGSFIKNIKIIL